MFSKALFKQSCKANGAMWGIITFAVCFMLACVMLISGNGSIGDVKNSIQDTIITKEVDAQLQKRALSYYTNASDGLREFDKYFAENSSDTLAYLTWCSKMPSRALLGDGELYEYALKEWQSQKPQMSTQAGKSFADTADEWISGAPSYDSFGSVTEYLAAMSEWSSSSPVTQENAITAAYAGACEQLSESISKKALASGFASGSTEEKEMLGAVMYTLNPNGQFNDFYTSNGEEIPSDYDYMSLISHVLASDVSEYIQSDGREEYRCERAQNGAGIFLAGNMSSEESVNTMITALSSYGVTREKYNSFGYSYSSIKHMANTSIVTYQGRADYELGLIYDAYMSGEYASEQEYTDAVSKKKAELSDDISSSFLSTLPSEVSEALEEVGQADLYTLIVGSIFYKLAGLLLPIIYMIMASNNLIAGQVDSGSMAYVLSTSTRRVTVVFTQAVYLVGSLLAMFSLTTVTGCVCLSIVSEEVELTYKNLILLNIGAFLVLLALSGLCFFTSCVFDRSKRSMALGGGLSIFALVAAMLGLFGSPVIPSVVRLDALNYFNYTTIISLFDVVSIMDGTGSFIWKFVILGVAGIIGYIAGSVRFIKKDLPL